MTAELQLPIWAQYIQAFLTPAIAVLALTIAYSQWQIARRKIVLDLFEKRYAAFEQIRRAVSRLGVYGTGKYSDVVDYHQAIDSAQFLFGDDVSCYLHNLKKSVDRLHSIETAPDRPQDQKAPEKETDDYLKSRKALEEFYEIFPRLMRQYMLMDHKLGERLTWKRLKTNLSARPTRT